MKNALHFSHQLLADLIQRFPNGTFIDATLGNGNDTHFIINQPHFKGHVYGFDIQKQAILNSVEKLQAHPKFNQVSLIEKSHDQIEKVVTEPTIAGAIFNLGYLPGGDHEITTRFNSTIAAIKQIAEKLVKRGQILLVIYSGHPAGMIEKQKLFDTLSTWSQKEYQVLQYEFINQQNQPPMLLIIEKIK
ncbi:MAG TPA: class I SAM-dependent methyltransferase [Globicatella sulfidifaciens]|nr:class I SAM-dependent methyltransferase [Globicatella sulfidifaciens]